MTLELWILAAIGLTAAYFILGLGVSNVYRQARGDENYDIVTIVAWPVALFVFAFLKKI